MKKNIFKIGFLFAMVLVFGNFFVSTSLAANEASATISPTTASTGQNQTYTYTITNSSVSTANLGSVEIVLPTGFSTPSVSISSASASKTWLLGSSGGYVNGFNSSTRKIGLQASGASDKLDVNEFVQIQITTTAPSTANSYEWTASPLANLGFSGTLFTLTSAQPTVNVTAPVTVTFIIRNGDSVLYNGSVSLPASGTVSINDSNNVSHSVNTRSVLALLKTIDDGSSAFSISNLQYFNSFGAFYIKCILPNGGSDLCDNWQYAVGSITPFSGIDATILSGGETVGIYFGNSHQVALNVNTIITGESINATAQKYDYLNNIWNPLAGVNIGVTLPNSADPFSPIVVSTHPVDTLGNTNITITGINTYTLGIAEDFYFPSYPVTVSPAPTSGGGSSTGGGISLPAFNIQNALSYLKSVQSSDGSFGGDLYTDWAGIALGALNINDSSKDKILAYFNSHNTISSLLTDNERHTMALLSLGQNPYSFNNVNYINAIVSSFDGTQFGNTNLVNDDIFALIPLANAGYNASDDMVVKDVAFLISKQKTNGSWEESADMTAAAIQALKSFEILTNVTDALLKATNYLASEQKSDGGWNSVYSTSWAMQAMNALNASWTKGSHTPTDYLSLQQASDGAVSSPSETSQNRIWATSYAIAAGSGKPWSAIMQSFPKSALTSTAPTPASSDVTSEEQVGVPTKSVGKNKTEEKKVIANAQTKKPTTQPVQLATINTPEIPSEALTASAVNAVPTERILKAAPIVLGAISGAALLYIIFKLLIIFL